MILKPLLEAKDEKGNLLDIEFNTENKNISIVDSNSNKIFYEPKMEDDDIIMYNIDNKEIFSITDIIINKKVLIAIIKFKYTNKDTIAILESIDKDELYIVGEFDIAGTDIEIDLDSIDTRENIIRRLNDYNETTSKSDILTTIGEFQDRDALILSLSYVDHYIVKLFNNNKNIIK